MTGGASTLDAGVRGRDAPCATSVTPVQAVPYPPLDTDWIEAQMARILFRQRAARRQQ